MKLDFLSVAYFLCLFLAVGFVVLMYFLLRKQSPKMQRMVLLLLMMVNIFQHLAKTFVWPHYWGRIDSPFAFENTAYNVCAFLILISPFVLYCKSSAVKDFLLYVGTAGPLLAITVPYWFQGQNLFQWEVARFYVCHNLLIATSVLPGLLKLTKPDYKNFWKIPLLFFLSLILITFNNVICVVTGLLPGGVENLYETLANYANPCMVMQPNLPAGFEWVLDLIKIFTPSVFLGDGTRPYTPLLWYAIPLFLLIAILAFLLSVALDAKRFSADIRSLKQKIRDLRGRKKE